MSAEFCAVGEACGLAVLAGQDGAVVDLRPVDGDIRGVPDQAVFVIRCVVVGALVEELSPRAGDQEAVGKSGWHPQLVLVVFTQELTHPLAEGGRALAQVDGDIEDFAARDPHQFALGLAQLVVQATQDAVGGFAVVVLHELVVSAVLLKLGLAEGFHEEATFVAEYLGLDQDDVGDGQRDVFHGFSPAVA